MQNETSSSLPYPTLLVHADDHLSTTTDIAPPLHPSTTYHYPLNVDDWHPVGDEDALSSAPIYTRLSYSTTERVEKVLGDLMGGTRRRAKVGNGRFDSDILFGIECHSCVICPCQSKQGMYLL